MTKHGGIKRMAVLEVNPRASRVVDQRPDAQVFEQEGQLRKG